MIDGDYLEGEAPGINDGRLLAPVSVGLAVAGIVIPIVMSIVAIVVAGIAKHRLGRGEDTKQPRSLASGAQLFAVLDMCGQAFFLTLIFSGLV